MPNQLTREECLEALNKIIHQCHDNDICAVSCFDCLTLDQLINEHFGNPPLKFEELEVGMWVWDNKFQEYVKILEVWCNGIIHYHNSCCVIVFEENRFYRHEVKENDDAD